MAGTIKGITVEIEGKTTKLTAALKDVQTSANNLQSNLKKVDAALKLDPSSTELLSEKQKILASYVDVTNEKLLKLESVQDQIRQQYADGKIDQGAYLDFQKELENTRAKLKNLENQQKEFGDTSKKALEDASKKCNDLEKNLSDVNDALKLDPGNVTLLTEKQKLLADSVDATKEKLKLMKDQQDKISADYAAGNIDRGAYLEFQTELLETEKKLKDLKEQQSEFGGVVKQVMQQAGEKVSDFGRKVGGVISSIGDGISKLGNGISSLGEKLMPVSAASGAVLSGSTLLASNFTDAMAKVNTIADTSKVSLEDLSDEILVLSDQTGISASEIADAVYNAISAGQDTADAVNFVSNATSLARAGFTDTASAIDILTTILNAYGLEASEATDICDKLITTQNLGKTTVAELASAMGKVIPTAKSQGVQIDELCGAYAVMTANGIATAETTTYLNSMLNELGKQGSTAADAFAAGTEHIKKGGLTMAEAMEQGWSLTDVLGVLSAQAEESGTSISNMFGSAEAGKAASVLADNAAKVNDAVAQMGKSAEATTTALEKLETPSHTVDVALNQLKNSGIELGQTVLAVLAPVLEDLSALISEVTSQFNSLSPEMKETIVTILAIVTALAPALVLGGKVITGLGTIIRAGGNLVSLLAGALSGAIKGIGLLITTLAKVPTLVVTLKGAFSAIAGVISSGLTSALGALGSALSWLAANPIVLIIAAIAALVVALIYLWNNCEEFREFWINLWETISTWCRNTIDSIVSYCKELPGKISAAIQDAISNVKTWGVNLKNTAVSAISSLVSDVYNRASRIPGLINSAITGAISYVMSWGVSLKNAAVSAIENVRSSISAGLERVKSLFHFEWSLPHIRIPHFTISGSFSLSPLSVPRIGVEWYAKGGILNGAQIFGALGNHFLGGGEAGPEAVLPLSSFYDNLRSILTSFIPAPGDNAADISPILTLLDDIYSRLGRLQVMLDTGVLVGEIVDPVDDALAAKQRLHARGV